MIAYSSGSEDILEVNNFSTKIWDSTSTLPVSWDGLVKEKNLFLSSHYFKALEGAMPKGMSLKYLGFYKNDNLVGVSLIQLIYVKASEAYRPTFKEGNQFSVKLDTKLKTLLPKRFNMQTLVAGNLMLTGKHAYYFNPDEITEDEFRLLWVDTVNKFRNNYNQNNQPKIKLTLLKDFFFEDKSNFDTSEFNNYHDFVVQPNMILDVRDSWDHFDDYLSALGSKYRTRYKRARKKFKGIVRHEFQLDDIIANQDFIYKAYKMVSDKAAFNTFILHKDYFASLKRNLGDKFKLFAYKKDGMFVAFYTVIYVGNTLETHFLGYCPVLNREHQVYLNMLYDMVELGVNSNVSDIIFARTATEIKSTVGASPHNMFGLMRYTNPFVNTLIKPIFSYLKQDEDVVIRRPFKSVN